jgi:adenosylcobinamide-GDP ribazoletransferase
MAVAEEQAKAGEAWAPLRAVRAAFVFLSRIPLGGFPYSAAAWRWAPAHFPLVGLAVGALSAAGYWAFASLDRFVAAVVAVAASVWVTGAFHEDGLADSTDALGGSHGNERLFEIMKDSRIGSYGAVSVALSLLLRVGALAALGGVESRLGTRVGVPGLGACAALLVVHVLSRTGPVWLIAVLPYVTGQGAKGGAVATAGVLQASVATVWSLGVLVALLALGAFSAAQLGIAVLLTVLFTSWLGRVFVRRAGGITGDFLGATEQLLECALLLALLGSSAPS